MQIRDRIKDFRRVVASQLKPHPRNWRTHPQSQQDAMRGVLAEIGYADALVARELDDGTLQLIDGHLRAETTPDMLVPVLVLDVDEQETLKLLATLDPLSAMAETDAELLAALVADVETDNHAVRAMLDALQADSAIEAAEEPAMQDLIVPSAFQVVVECGDESQQRMVYERMTGEGFRCRVLSL